jgi:hypothetical protein
MKVLITTDMTAVFFFVIKVILVVFFKFKFIVHINIYMQKIS